MSAAVKSRASHLEIRDSRLKGAQWWRQVGWRHIVGVIGIVYAIFPLIYVFSASLKPRTTLTGSNELFSEVKPDNYANLFDTGFAQWALNSLFISSAAAIGTVLMGGGSSVCVLTLPVHWAPRIVNRVTHYPDVPANACSGGDLLAVAVVA